MIRRSRCVHRSFRMTTIARMPCAFDEETFEFTSPSHGQPAAGTGTTPGWGSQIFLGITYAMYNACGCPGVVYSKIAGATVIRGPSPRFLHDSRVRSRQPTACQPTYTAPIIVFGHLRSPLVVRCIECQSASTGFKFTGHGERR